MLAKQRKVEVVTGVGKFISEHEIEVTAKDGKKETVQFQQCDYCSGFTSSEIAIFT